MPPTRDRADARRLDAWIDGLEAVFADGFCPSIGDAKLWGRLAAERPRAIVDTLIAATALTHDLRLVTRRDRCARHGVDCRSMG